MAAISSIPLQRNTPDGVVKIDLDERAFLFPQPKSLTQLQLYVHKPSLIRFEVVYAFNHAHASSALFDINVHECAELSRRLVEAVYRAQSTQIVTDNVSVAMTIAPNGYIIQINEHAASTEMFIGTGSIWRVLSGIARAVDLLAPQAGH